MKTPFPTDAYAGMKLLVSGPRMLRDIELVRPEFDDDSGEIEVDGQKYNGVMTPQGDMLDDLQIAAVITYERLSWGNDYGACMPNDVKAAR